MCYFIHIATPIILGIFKMKLQMRKNNCNNVYHAALFIKLGSVHVILSTM